MPPATRRPQIDCRQETIKPQGQNGGTQEAIGTSKSENNGAEPKKGAKGTRGTACLGNDGS